MKLIRLFLVFGALVAAAALTAAVLETETAAAISTPSASSTTPTLGLDLYPDNSAGFGAVAPSEINYGGDPTSYVDGVHWANWGAAKAVGHGIADWVWPGWCVACGSVEKKATVVAFDLGSCNGHPAYQEVEWYFPSVGMTFDRRLAGDNLCTDKVSEPAAPFHQHACSSVILRNASGAVSGFAGQIEVNQGTCAAVRRLLTLSRPARFFAHDIKYRSDGWYCGSEIDGEQIPPQSFTCQKGDFEYVSFDLSPADE